MQDWRLVVATDKPMADVTATFTLPEQVRNELGNYTISLGTASVNSRIGNWGGNYGNYQWAPLDPTQLVNNRDGTITANIGNLEAKQGTAFQFDASAILTGEYQETECPAPAGTTVVNSAPNTPAQARSTSAPI